MDGKGTVDVRPVERREHRRVKLRLPITSLGGQVPEGFEGVCTTDISAGGMYIRVPPARAPTCGAEVSFVLTVPPGQGYSSTVGRITGTGCVIRSVPTGRESVGVAVHFARPLKLEF